MKAVLFFSLILSLTSGALLFHIKHKVLSLEQSIKVVSKKLLDTKEHLSVLKAEWSYLTHPKRINKLISRYLSEVRPLRKEQLIVLPQQTSETVMTKRPSHSAL